MPYDIQERQLQELLLPSYLKEYDDDIPKTTSIGWLKNYFRGHFLPSIKRNLCIIIFFSVCLLILLCSQHNSNDDDDMNESSVPFIDDEKNSDHFLSNSRNEKFITFLPHGNLFQQREELENAVFLANTLGRTLIIPPMILGLKVEFINSQDLREKLKSLRTDKHDSECFVKTTIPEQKETKYDLDVNCLNQFDSYSLLRWDSLFDLNWIEKRLHILHGRDFDQVKLAKMLNITNSKRDVHEIMKSSLKGKPITLDSVRSRKEKLLTFDSLLRVDLNKKDLSQNQWFLNQLDASLVINNPDMLNVSKKIIQKLGGKGNYVGVHARFVSTSSSNEFIENSLENLSSSLKDYFRQTSQDLCGVDSPVIYLATDLSRNDINLSSFLTQFPCVAMLSDFDKILLPLLELYNPRDGTFLFKFLEPLINSIIASSGMKLFSIDDEIYSEYAKKLYASGG